jgi:DNA methylase
MPRKLQNNQKGRLFEETLVPAMPGSDKLFDVSYGYEASKPVECLGMTFPNDEARRAFFTKKLREKLKNPAFRKIDGFPIGDDEDILVMSDPPYYTACPNPFLNDFIQCHGRPYDPENNSYRREPFAADVSEGKGDPIYNAHSYHTKVPHKAIMRYILHYTDPGDMVFDGFCGTGMTGVAAQLCGDLTAVESLGYKAKSDGTVLEDGTPFSRLGPRQAILGDLSPAATFIAYNYTTPIDSTAFRSEGERILAKAEAALGWMYLTLDRPKAAQVTTAVALLKTHKTDLPKAGTRLPWGRINYTIWSDVFLCSNCGGEVVFWDAAVDKEVGKVRDEFPCPHCNTRLTKRNMVRGFVTDLDSSLQKNIRQAKQVPVLINYTAGKYRSEKLPDEFDRALLNAIGNNNLTDWFPTDPMPKGFNTEQPKVSHGATHAHQFYTKRNLRIIAAFRSAGLKTWLPFNALTPRATRLHRIAASRIGGEKKGEGGATVGVLPGTLYIPSNSVEMNVLDQAEERIVAAARGLSAKSRSFLTTGSAASVPLPAACIDYIFTDPPFGGNLMYSELNYIWECWLRVKTNNGPEAIENSVQNKGPIEYQRLMTDCFIEYYRLLKPGRWMTVEFHNSQNRVWTAIQEGIQHAGFVVCDVRTLDKKQGSFKQYTSVNAVKRDLVISAYKPSLIFEEQFKVIAGIEAGAWEFIRSHLRHIPVFVANGGRAEVVAERQGYLLFDRMVAFHVQRGWSPPLSAAEFYAGLRQKFPTREGMYFLTDQVADYDRQRASITEVEQLQLFVNDEKTAIQWVRRQLTGRPTTYQDLQPRYMKEAQRVWDKHEQPLELRTILEQNFVEDGKGRWSVPDPKNEVHLEQLRHRELMREFQQYLDTKGKLKIIRTEALRAGFKECWQNQDYRTIIEMAKRVPEAVVQEDQALLMYYDNAMMRSGE